VYYFFLGIYPIISFFQWLVGWKMYKVINVEMKGCAHYYLDLGSWRRSPLFNSADCRTVLGCCPKIVSNCMTQ
jgi:hypothetical protein